MERSKVYDRDFKENAVMLSYQRDTVSSLAKELGIRVKLLYSWRSEFRQKGSESFPGKGKTTVTSEAQELERISKDYARLQKEHEILKKALSIISRSGL